MVGDQFGAFCSRFEDSSIFDRIRGFDDKRRGGLLGNEQKIGNYF
jgi:hypothetical protein